MADQQTPRSVLTVFAKHTSAEVARGAAQTVRCRQRRIEHSTSQPGQVPPSIKLHVAKEYHRFATRTRLQLDFVRSMIILLANHKVYPAIFPKVVSLNPVFPRAWNAHKQDAIGIFHHQRRFESTHDEHGMQHQQSKHRQTNQAAYDSVGVLGRYADRLPQPLRPERRDCENRRARNKQSNRQPSSKSARPPDSSAEVALQTFPLDTAPSPDCIVDMLAARHATIIACDGPGTG
jgi:hypothetical protein